MRRVKAAQAFTGRHHDSFGCFRRKVCRTERLNQLSRSGFYAWLGRPRSHLSQVDEVLASQVRQRLGVSDPT